MRMKMFFFLPFLALQMILISLSDMLRSHSWLGLWFYFTGRDHLHGQRPRGFDFTVIRLERSRFVFLYRKKPTEWDATQMRESSQETTWAPLIQVFQPIFNNQKRWWFFWKHYIKTSSSFCLKLVVKEVRRPKDPLWATTSAADDQQGVLLRPHAQTHMHTGSYCRTGKSPHMTLSS